MVMMTCGENEENAENKCDDYHGDELGLEYEVDEEVELAEIQLDIKKMKKIVHLYVGKILNVLYNK